MAKRVPITTSTTRRACRKEEEEDLEGCDEDGLDDIPVEGGSNVADGATSGASVRDLAERLEVDLERAGETMAGGSSTDSTSSSSSSSSGSSSGSGDEGDEEES